MPRLLEITEVCIFLGPIETDEIIHKWTDESLKELDKLTVENVKEVEVEDWSENEENIEFDPVIFHLQNGDTMDMHGYNGHWEMLSYDKLRDECKKEFLDSMIEWAKQQPSIS